MITLDEIPQKIVIRTPNWLGDLMMSTAFIQAVLKCYPQAQVDLIVKSGFETLPLPHRGKILPFNKAHQGLFSFGRRLRSQDYDQFYVLPPSFSAAWMAFWSGSRKRIGYTHGGRNLLLTSAQTYHQPHRTQHLIQEYLNLLPFSLPLETHPPQLNLSSQWIQEHQPKRFLNLPSSYIVFAPGALFGPAKQWPAENYQELAQLLKKKTDLMIVIGTLADRPLGEQIQKKNDQVLNWCGETSLNELIVLLSSARLLVSNDSGSMHLMAALQRPQVAVFGSTSTIWTGPVNSQARCLSLNLECAPCFQPICPLQHTNCLRQLRPQQVFDAIKELITVG